MSQSDYLNANSLLDKAEFSARSASTAPELLSLD